MVIAQGSKGINNGDVNLWGIEKPLSITKAQKSLQFKMKLAQELEIKITPQNLHMQKFKMKRLFCLFLRLCIMRCAVLGNVVRQYASSLLGSYIQQESYKRESCSWKSKSFYSGSSCSYSSMLQVAFK